MSQIVYPETYVVWDLETSGFSPEDNRILEIGAMEVKNGEVVREHNWILNQYIPDPNFELQPVITEVTGLRQDDIKRGQDPRRVIREFIDVLNVKRQPHVTHNGLRFDLPFLVAEIDRTTDDVDTERFSEFLYHNALDTAVFVKAAKLGMQRKWNQTFQEFGEEVMSVMAKGITYNVKGTCEEMGISMEDITLHRASGDVHLTNEIYKRVVK